MRQSNIAVTPTHSRIPSEPPRSPQKQVIVYPNSSTLSCLASFWKKRAQSWKKVGPLSIKSILNQKYWQFYDNFRCIHSSHNYVPEECFLYLSFSSHINTRGQVLTSILGTYYIYSHLILTTTPRNYHCPHVIGEETEGKRNLGKLRNQCGPRFHHQ